MFKLLLSVALTVVYVEYSNACSCYPGHPQTRFCEADFAFKVQILSKSTVTSGGNSEYKYRVKITYDFMTLTKHKTNPKYTYIYSDTRGNFCGVNIPVGSTKWLISGTTYKGKKTTSICNWNKKIRELTTYQKNSLKLGNYKKGCKCVTKPNAFKRLLLCNTIGIDKSCYDKHAICVTSATKRCMWIKESGKCT